MYICNHGFKSKYKNTYGSSNTYVDKKRGEGHQNWVKFGPRSYWMSPLPLCLINCTNILSITYCFLVQFFVTENFQAALNLTKLRILVISTKTGLKRSESLNYCPKTYLSLIYICRRSHKIYWSLCSYWRKSSFKYSKKSSLEAPYKRQIYLQYWKWPRMDHWPFERHSIY